MRNLDASFYWKDIRVKPQTSTTPKRSRGRLQSSDRSLTYVTTFFVTHGQTSAVTRKEHV